MPNLKRAAIMIAASSMASLTVLGLLLTFSHVHVVGVDRAESPVLLVGQTAFEDGPLVPTTITVQLMGGAGRVEMIDLPTDVLAAAATDEFVISPNQATLQSGTLGAQIEVVRALPSITLIVTATAPDTTFLITANSIQESIHLSATGDLEHVGIRNARYEVQSKRLGIGGAAIAFDGPVNEIEVVQVGPLPVDHEIITNADSAIAGIVVTKFAIVQAVSRALWSFVPQALITLATIAVSLAVGSLLSSALGTRLSRPLDALEATTSGFAAGLLTLGALNYFVSTQRAMIIGGVCLLASHVVMAVRKARSGHSSPSGLALPRPHLSQAIVFATITTVVMAPLVFSGGFAMGYLQTDVYDTVRLTQVYWLDSGLGASLDFGNGFRLLDYTARAALAGWRSDPGEAVAILRLLLTFLLLSWSWRLCKTLGSGAAIASLVCALVVLNGPLTALFAEGYMTRTFFIQWMTLGMLMAATHLASDSVDRWGLVAAGIVLAVSTAVVPPFSIAVAAVALGVIAQRRAGTSIRATTRALTPFLGAWLIGSVPNLIWLKNVADADRYIPTLNAIGRFTVVPFNAEPTFAATLVGLVPFHSNTQHWLPEAQTSLSPPFVANGQNALVGTSWTTAIFWVSALALTSTTIAAFRRGDRAQRAVAMLLASTIAAVVVGYLVLRRTSFEDQTYFVLMYPWSLAPAALAAAGLLLAQRARHSTKAVNLATLALIVLVTINLASSAQDANRWFEAPRGETAQRSQLDVIAELQAFVTYLDDTDAPSRHSLVQVPSTLQGTDDDRVLANHIDVALQGRGSTCVGCTYDSPVGQLSFAPEVQPEAVNVIIGVGTCDGAVIYLASRFQLCDTRIAPG
ncbi:MAG: hypothetical protein ACI8Y4_002686 [Candidatus Poriferisodalaceae bacterium]